MILTQLVPPRLPAADLSVSLSSEGAATIVTLRGEADLFTLPLVVDALARVTADHEGPVVVDLAGTTFVDSGTARMFARASRVLGDRGRRLTIRSPSRIAVRVLTILELSDLIEETTSGSQHATGATRKTEAAVTLR